MWSFWCGPAVGESIVQLCTKTALAGASEKGRVGKRELANDDRQTDRQTDSQWAAAEERHGQKAEQTHPLKRHRLTFGACLIHFAARAPLIYIYQWTALQFEFAS